VPREDDHPQTRVGESNTSRRDPHVPPAEEQIHWPEPSPLNDWWQTVMNGGRNSPA